jgi:hypothetical protein
MTRRNRAETGRLLEVSALRFLQALGWVMHRTIRNAYSTSNGPRSNGNDVFGAVDLVGKKLASRTLWVQVTKHTTVGAKIQELEMIPWDNRFDDVQIWRWVGSEGKRDSNFFQVYKRDEGYRLDPANRIRPQPAPKPPKTPVQAQEPETA